MGKFIKMKGKNIIIRNYKKNFINFSSSLAVWNYVESQYWHPSLDNANKRFVPSQIVTPILENSSNLINSDVGKVVAIRSLYVTIDFDLLNGYNPKQVNKINLIENINNKTKKLILDLLITRLWPINTMEHFGDNN